MEKVLPEPTKFRPGIRLSTLPCCVAWIDLIGYGSMISLSGFRPYKPSAAAAIERLKVFHETVSRHAHRHFPAFVMNDGAAIYKDLSLWTASVTADFVQRAVSLHVAIGAVEAAAGYPGARMVIASGLRHRAGVPRPPEDREQIASIRKRMNDGVISAKQAVEEAWKARSIVAPIFELQANFAFTKAYLADSSGSAGGISGSDCYIDDELFDEAGPIWLKTEEPFFWRSKSPPMSGRFRKVQSIEPTGPATSQGLKTGFQVFAQASREGDAEQVLRSLET